MSRRATATQSDGSAPPALETDQALLEELRQAPPQQDDDGRSVWPAADPSRPVGKGNPPRGRRSQTHKPRATHMEVETRIAEGQLWIAQRLPLAVMREKAAQNWGITNIKTISKYLALARQRMGPRPFAWCKSRGPNALIRG
ncbi:hypothetical protein [Synechococcus sp. BA-132 BA5]|uniref:hypothetical protein n=1 Tax=Synechococcus sp. BA-132 BA5 TaxID=3110252 RepID=UPI002B1EF695|nr:hypothetical protein [Synechococcus sp. BA-132 BA5]MEA5415052.1 hypothetical protein [Synechococcus sp. BA-132 BA5]